MVDRSCWWFFFPCALFFSPLELGTGRFRFLYLLPFALVIVSSNFSFHFFRISKSVFSCLLSSHDRHRHRSSFNVNCTSSFFFPSVALGFFLVIFPNKFIIILHVHDVHDYDYDPTIFFLLLLLFFLFFLFHPCYFINCCRNFFLSPSLPCSPRLHLSIHHLIIATTIHTAQHSTHSLTAGFWYVYFCVMTS